jgi:hypothetical protein
MGGALQCKSRDLTAKYVGAWNACCREEINHHKLIKIFSMFSGRLNGMFVHHLFIHVASTALVRGTDMADPFEPNSPLELFDYSHGTS